MYNSYSELNKVQAVRCYDELDFVGPDVIISALNPDTTSLAFNRRPFRARWFHSHRSEVITRCGTSLVPQVRMRHHTHAMSSILRLTAETSAMALNHTAHLAALGLIPLASTSPHALRAVDRAFHSVRIGFVYNTKSVCIHYMQHQVNRCAHCIPHQVIGYEPHGPPRCPGPHPPRLHQPPRPQGRRPGLPFGALHQFKSICRTKSVGVITVYSTKCIGYEPHGPPGCPGPHSPRLHQPPRPQGRRPGLPLGVCSLYAAPSQSLCVPPSQYGYSLYGAPSHWV
jgi:hypothetical protein